MLDKNGILNRKKKRKTAEKADRKDVDMRCEGKEPLKQLKLHEVK